MSKKNKNRRRLPVAPPQLDPLMTISEARAEVVFIALQMLLPKLSQSVCKSVRARCYAESDSIGDETILEEMEFLFHYVQFERPAR